MADTGGDLPQVDPDLMHATRVVLRPIATPFPLAFMVLACATLLVAGQELGWFAPSDTDVVALTLIAFAFPLQLLASVFGFLGRDTVAATGFGIQSATWLMIGLVDLLRPADTTSPALGVLLIASATAILICTAGSALGKLAPALVLGLTALRFLLTGLHEVSGAIGVGHIAAIVGLVLVPVAAYVALALELENLQRRTVLPLLRRGLGAEAMRGSFAQQSRRLQREAGVREQL
ncbi:MAG TPA: hypothetical protein VHW04_06320 [Solirubrobacteraceae bacterium]|jgi:hypothetical protein|nr:hypothetical protein [Solirubrobacteraceae bacterium]